MHKILVIEDNPLNAEAMTLLLRPIDCEIILAEDATTGIRLAESSNPDLILLDMQLPDMDGKFVALNLKKTASTRHIPIIAVTADDSTETERFATYLGCEEVIHKPLNIQEFVKRVAAYLPTTSE